MPASGARLCSLASETTLVHAQESSHLQQQLSQDEPGISGSEGEVRLLQRRHHLVRPSGMLSEVHKSGNSCVDDLLAQLDAQVGIAAELVDSNKGRLQAIVMRKASANAGRSSECRVEPS